MSVNYQLALDRTIAALTDSGKRPSLLLHSCCGPCSSYVLEYLTRYFEITVYYYNPNIYPESEYVHRLQEQEKLITEAGYRQNASGNAKVSLLPGEYEDALYKERIRWLEAEPEGGNRCRECFRLRLEKTAKKAAALGFDFFSTTLSVSPHKNAQLLNELGEEIGKEYGIPYLFSDFKKKNGYQRSIALSHQYGLYRQNYCGCVFSMNAEKRHGET